MWIDLHLAYLTCRLYSTEARDTCSTFTYLGVGGRVGNPGGEGSPRKGQELRINEGVRGKRP